MLPPRGCASERCIPALLDTPFTASLVTAGKSATVHECELGERVGDLIRGDLFVDARAEALLPERRRVAVPRSALA
jgi:hypothetical protein